MLKPVDSRRGRFVIFATLKAVALLILVAGGCAQNRYSIRNLPEPLQSRPVLNPQTLDLSPFAGPPINAEAIDVGDELTVSIVAGLNEESQTTFPVRVGEDGIGVLPEIGLVRLVGLIPLEAERQIVEVAKERNVYRQPTVTVAVSSQRTNMVRVIGAVRRASVVGGVRQNIIHELPYRSSYLKAAIDAGGGLAQIAGTKVWIWRPSPPQGEPQMVMIDLTDPTDRSRGSPYLCDGSVVEVEERPPRPVQVEGLVKNPGPVEFSVIHGLSLSEAVGRAGGLSSRVANEVVVTREGLDLHERGNIALNLDNDTDRNFALMPGDIVRVKQTAGTWALDMLQSVFRFSVGSSIPLW